MELRFGRYQALREVAIGGMATVYLGRALGEGGFERLVAIKLLHRQFANQPEFEAMFLDEAKLAAQIRHPNVVPTLDVQKAPEGLFIVMDYVEGPSLAAIVKELQAARTRLPLEILLRVFDDLLAGLDAAHRLLGPGGVELEIVHRDVSPQNVLVGGDGITRITDFGVARAAVRSTTTEQGQIKGKLGYMPPEQLAGLPVDARADVYSTGVVLWEALTGRRAFAASNTGLLLARVLAGVEKSPRAVLPGVPEQLDEVCMRALDIDPEQRHPTASAFAAELARAGRSLGIAPATAREVADFVQQLECYRARVVPPDLLFAPVPSAEPSFLSSERPTRAPAPPLNPDAVGEPLSSEGGAATGSPAAISVVTSATTRTARRWLLPVAAVGCAIGLGVGAMYAVGQKATEPSPRSELPPTSSPASGPSTGAIAGPGEGGGVAASPSASMAAAPSLDAALGTGGASGDAAAPPGSPTPAPTRALVPTKPQATAPRTTAAPPPTALPSNPEDYNPSVL